MRGLREVAIVAAFVFALGGCASVPDGASGWFGETPPAAPHAPAGQAFYATTADLAVRDQPSGTGTVVGKLALHEKVTRSRVQDGYAHVVANSGLAGWVDNTQLIARLPAAAGGSPASGGPGVKPPVSPHPAAATPVPLPPVPETPPLVVPAAEPAPPAVAPPGRAKPAAEMVDPF